MNQANLSVLTELLDGFTPHGQQEISDLSIFKTAAKDARNLTRDSLAHFTASAFVLNEKQDKALAIYHKIYQSWGWMGGHADGDADLLRVALKEVREESGLSALTVLSETPISIEDVPVFGHVHRTHGYVSAHLHLNVTFLLQANEHDLLHKNEAETDGIAWLALDQFSEKSSEPEMRIIYDKIISRIKERKNHDEL